MIIVTSCRSAEEGYRSCRLDWAASVPTWCAANPSRWQRQAPRCGPGSRQDLWGGLATRFDQNGLTVEDLADLTEADLRSMLMPREDIAAVLSAVQQQAVATLELGRTSSYVSALTGGSAVLEAAVDASDEAGAGAGATSGGQAAGNDADAAGGMGSGEHPAMVPFLSLFRYLTSGEKVPCHPTVPPFSGQCGPGPG